MLHFSTLVSLGALGVAAYQICLWLGRKDSTKQHDCHNPPKRHTRDRVLGLGYKIRDITLINEGNILPDGESLHRQYGLTFHEPSIFGTTIKTASEENIRAVFGTHAKEWGVGPFRNKGFMPFCGDGVLSADGPVWERSRSLLKSSFLKSNISDLTDFETLVGQFLEKLPTDGSTLDLDPLLSKMVTKTFL